MPEESFEGLLLAAGPEAVQRFLALLHRVGLRLHGEVARGARLGQDMQGLCGGGRARVWGVHSMWGYSRHVGAQTLHRAGAEPVLAGVQSSHV